METIYQILAKKAIGKSNFYIFLNLQDFDGALRDPGTREVTESRPGFSFEAP